MKVNTDKSFAGVFSVTARFILTRAHWDLGYFSFCFLFFLLCPATKSLAACSFNHVHPFVRPSNFFYSFWSKNFICWKLFDQDFNQEFTKEHNVEHGNFFSRYRVRLKFNLSMQSHTFSTVFTPELLYFERKASAYQQDFQFY